MQESRTRKNKASVSNSSTAQGRRARRLLVLDTIRARKQVARIDIAALTGLSAATVTTIANELLTAGLIEPCLPDDDPTTTRRGRPREALQLRGAAKLVAGIKLGSDTITVLLMDFEGKDTGLYEHPIDIDRLPAEQLCHHVIAAAKAACDHTGRHLSDLSAMAISLAGQIDGATGFVHWSSALSHRNVRFGPMLEALSPCPVFLENDANLVAKAEQLFGYGKDVDNFVVVTLERGIGLGIVINGKLYRGARGCGAEFGHMKLGSTGALCQCGQYDCLEAYAGEYALLGRCHDNRRFASIAALVQAAEAGDITAQTRIDVARQTFARGLANLINIFDPQLLVIASRIGADHPLCVPSVLTDAVRNTVQVDTSMPEIRVHGWGDMIWAKGAAAYGIAQISKLAVRGLARKA